VFGLAFVPLGWLAFRVWTGRTGPNPAEDIILTAGIWALRFLLITLAVTPVRRLTGLNLVIQYRRMLGLFAFFYACVHLFSYMLFDRLFQIGEILTDIADRPFILAGMTALALMIPLAVTSTKGWIRRLGRRWQTLHRIVYFSAAAACLHFAWKVKVVVANRHITPRSWQYCSDSGCSGGFDCPIDWHRPCAALKTGLCPRARASKDQPPEYFREPEVRTDAGKVWRRIRSAHGSRKTRSFSSRGHEMKWMMSILAAAAMTTWMGVAAQSGTAMSQDKKL